MSTVQLDLFAPRAPVAVAPPFDPGTEDEQRRILGCTLEEFRTRVLPSDEPTVPLTIEHGDGTPPETVLITRAEFDAQMDAEEARFQAKAAAAPPIVGAPAGGRRGAKPPRPADDDLEPPDVILAEMIALEVAGGLEIAALGRELGMAPEQGDRWAVFVSVGGKVDAPLPVLAPNAYAAEKAAAKATGAPAERCLALPGKSFPDLAWPTEGVGQAMAREPGTGLAAALEQGMVNASLLAAEANRSILRMLADLNGCTVEEYEAQEAVERAADEAKKGQMKARTKAEKVDDGQGNGGKGKASAAGWSRQSKGKELSTRRLTARQQELLAQVRVDGQRVVFGGGIIEDWEQVTVVLKTLGGVYRSGGKKARAEGTRGHFAFEADVNVREVIALAQETGEVLDPSIVGFFGTPVPLANRVVSLVDLRAGMRVLEPSGGAGALVAAVLRLAPTALLYAAELLDDNRAKLQTLGVELIGRDFLAIDHESLPPFDALVGNPPFDKGADTKHVTWMVRFLAPGAKAAVIVGNGVTFRDEAASLRAFVAAHGGKIVDLPRDSFASEGTMTKTALVTWTACARCRSGGCIR